MFPTNTPLTNLQDGFQRLWSLKHHLLQSNVRLPLDKTHNETHRLYMKKKPAAANFFTSM
jgi:hypothetical protein